MEPVYIKDVKLSIISSLHKIKEEARLKKQDDDFKNSTGYKYFVLKNAKKASQELCLDKILSKLYKDALPLNDEYKAQYSTDLDKDFATFLNNKCPEGIVYYIHEERDKGNEFAKQLCEAVEKLVNDEYKDKELNIDNVPTDEINTDLNTPEIDEKIAKISDDLDISKIAEVINDNVKNTAMSEITRAKDEKEKLANIEKELANDVKINSDEAIESALELRDLNTLRTYEPSLFDGIMINKTNKLTPRYESGELEGINIYNTLSSYSSKEVLNESVEKPAEFMDLVFIETVKEYTALSILKAVKFESFDLNYINKLANKYAQERF